MSSTSATSYVLALVNEVQSYTPRFGHFIGFKKLRKSLGRYFFMKKIVKIYKKYLLFTHTLLEINFFAPKFGRLYGMVLHE